MGRNAQERRKFEAVQPGKMFECAVEMLKWERSYKTIEQFFEQYFLVVLTFDCVDEILKCMETYIPIFIEKLCF